MIEALISAVPSILCNADQETALGRTILNFLDPDTAQMMNLNILEVCVRPLCLFRLNKLIILIVDSQRKLLFAFQ